MAVRQTIRRVLRFMGGWYSKHADLEQFLRAATQTRFAVRAYFFMPDHLHLLVEGITGDADFRQFMKRGKQLSGYHGKRMTGHRLWVAGYYERIVRHDEDPRRFTQYILLNPVRAKLADAVGKHTYTWADTSTLDPHQ
jgi:putative transposase